MKAPQIKENLSSYQFLWPEEEISIEVSRLKLHSDGRLTGQLLIETTATGVAPHLHQALFNFTSSTARVTLGRILKSRYKEVDWEEALEQVCVHTLKNERRGAPVVELDPTKDIPPPSWLLYPLLPLNQPTMIFGEGGSGKSLVALLISIIVILSWYDNPFQLRPTKKSITVLWLDYEADQEQTEWRLKAMLKGLGLEYATIMYRRCDTPLADDIDQIKEHIVKTGANLLVVDSVGAACGGDPGKADIAIPFMNGVRKLNLTSLLLTHTSKDMLTKIKSAFGSVFFRNLSRSMWEIRKAQEAGEDTISIGLFHDKHNYSKKFPPMGFAFGFDNEAKEINVLPQDVNAVDEFLSKLPQKDQIQAVLRDVGMPQTVEDIAEMTGIAPRTVKARLYEHWLKGKHLFEQTDDDKWKNA